MEELYLDIRIRGCWGQDEGYPCMESIALAVEYENSIIGLCPRHYVQDYQRYMAVPLREIITAAWEQGHTSDISTNPWF